MDHTITLRKADGTWTLRAGGAVLAESTTAIELTEKNAPPQIYFPCRDVAMALLEPSNHTSHCDHKGTAHYFSIITKSTKLANVASGYANPTEALAAIKDHVTFFCLDLNLVSCALLCSKSVVILNRAIWVMTHE